MHLSGMFAGKVSGLIGMEAMNQAVAARIRRLQGWNFCINLEGVVPHSGAVRFKSGNGFRCRYGWAGKFRLLERLSERLTELISRRFQAVGPQLLLRRQRVEPERQLGHGVDLDLAP